MFSFLAFVHAQCNDPNNRCSNQETAVQLTADSPYNLNTTTDYFSNNNFGALGNTLDARITITAETAASIAAITVQTGGTTTTLSAVGDQVTIPAGNDYDFTVETFGTEGSVTILLEGLFSGAPAFSTPTTLVVMAPLPVTWARPLAAHPRKQLLDLSWSVTDQVDVDRYVVEASESGAVFTEVQTVNTRKQSGEIDYAATLPAPSELTYYRIRQYDFDGESSVSNTIEVAGYGEIAALRVFPNPASGVLNLRSASRINRIDLFAADGRRVLTLAQPGNRIELPNLPSGLYTVAAELANDTQTHERLIVR